MLINSQFPRAALLTAAALLLVISCGRSPRTEPAKALVTVEGRLLDRIDSLPVAQASILFREAKMGAMSDTAGFYLVRRLPAGKYTVELSGVQYARQRHQLTIPAAPDTVRLDFYLDRLQYDNFGHPIDPGDTTGHQTGIQPQ